MYHDTNFDCGHCEPFLYKKQLAMNIERSNDYLSPVFKDLQNYWKSTANELWLHQLDRPKLKISDCGDRIFSAICQMIAIEFGVHSLRLYIAQKFCNAIMGKCKDALDCLEKYLTNDVIQNQP